ncbi:MAG: hypothetical protein R3F49_09135 [Planctomycetota bacterium]
MRPGAAAVAAVLTLCVASASVSVSAFGAPTSALASSGLAPFAGAPSAAALDGRGIGKRVRTAWNRLVRPRSPQPKGAQPMGTPQRQVQRTPVHHDARGVVSSAPSAGAPAGVTRRVVVAPGRPPLVRTNPGIPPRGAGAPIATQWDRPMVNRASARPASFSRGLVNGRGPVAASAAPITPAVEKQPRPLKRGHAQLPDLVRPLKDPRTQGTAWVAPPASAPPLTLRPSQPAVTLRPAQPAVTLTTWQPLDLHFTGSVAGQVTGIKPIHTVGGQRIELTKRTYNELLQSKAIVRSGQPRYTGPSNVELLRKLAERVGVSSAPALRLKKDFHLIGPLLPPM